MALIKTETSNCPTCGSHYRIFTVKLAPTGLKDNHPAIPKYKPMIKKSCGKCGRYLKFEAQTEKLIQEINDQQENEISNALSKYKDLFWDGRENGKE